MIKSKDPNDVRGQRINCYNFEKCPLCYGCRAFNSRFVKCQQCKLENQKLNICNTKKHRADLIEKMITKEVIEVR